MERSDFAWVLPIGFCSRGLIQSVKSPRSSCSSAGARRGAKLVAPRGAAPLSSVLGEAGGLRRMGGAGGKIKRGFLMGRFTAFFDVLYSALFIYLFIF